MSFAEFEEAVKEYFENEGFGSKRGVTLTGKAGVKFEIDVLAEKDSKKVGCECKKWKGKVGKTWILNWIEICRRVGIKPAFASYNGFKEDAVKIGRSEGVLLLDREKLGLPEPEKSYEERIIDILREYHKPMSTKNLADLLNVHWSTVQQRCLKLQNENRIGGFRAGRVNIWFYRPEGDEEAEIEVLNV